MVLLDPYRCLTNVFVMTSFRHKCFLNIQLWTNCVGNVEISLGTVCKHEMCTTIVGWIDSLRSINEQQVSIDMRENNAKENDAHPTLDALLQAPVFPDRKLKLLQKLSAELMSRSTS